ncbi:cAMP-specific 3, 5 -cyclic phosphodiesterase 4D [Lecanosticta acicola]|uniref:Phosphodiesterase n=1 Tax=Lecanosticta acicola TaxID=111012 RepID=A0AAI9EEV4_9PEZI|nr:cAMP-specific 3, 5 -cyclic phosphodiesterase 4D [Lecanosticta acicola]
MEETDNGTCSVVYFCPVTEEPFSELFDSDHAPVAPDGQQPSAASRHNVYGNVRRLLDKDQGDFDRVFVGSSQEECLQTLESFAKIKPTAVLIELSDATLQHDAASTFLRALSPDAQKPNFHHHVMPFILLATSSPDDLPGSSHDTSNLGAGAIDTMRSPLCPQAMDQLMGHIKGTTRPCARLLGADMATRLLGSLAKTNKPRAATHRPDEILSAQRKSAVEEAIAQWGFPAHTFDMDELTYGALSMLEHVLQNPVLEPYRLSRSELMTFLLAVRREYKHEREVHYHNWRHAVDVTQSLYCFLCDVRLCPPSESSPRIPKEAGAVERLLSPIDALILLVSAIGHDVGHPGVNNAFLVASSHQLAQIYNDKSVLENYHCAAYSQLLRRHWPALITYPHFRPSMISTILATDMQRHFEYMGHLKDLKQKVDNSQEGLSDWNDKDREHARELIMALLIKAADISNVARPFEIAARWAKILMNEFSRQGELEHQLQIPTCLFGGPPDREDLLAAAQSQKGFLNLFGFPLFRGVAEIMPNISCSLPCLENNKDTWEQKISDEKVRREAGGDGRRSSRTYGSVTEKEVEEARMRKRESEPTAVPSTVPHTPSEPHQRQPGLDRSETPNRHPGTDERQRLQHGVPPAGDETRAPTPVIWPGSSTQLSPTAIGGSSRRSSKDVALNQLQELSAIAQQNLATAGSRRGSADAGWQIHQNYPGSRRGSKEESLTTILVASQGSSPASRSVPPSPKVGKSASPSKAASSSKRHSFTKPMSSTARSAAASSKSQTTNSPTVTTDLQTASTQPSSLATTDDDAIPPMHSSIIPGGGADPLVPSTDWTPGMDCGHQSSAPAALLRTSTEPEAEQAKPDSPRIIARMASGEYSPRDATGSESHLRQSRSRSRLRGLKFWRRKRDASGLEGAGPTSVPGPTESNLP